MRRYVLFLALFGIILTSMAAPVSRDEASALVASFLKQRSVNEVETEFDHFYIFTGEQGFVIISADDCVMPVLGYSYEGSFPAGAIPEHVIGWLRSYDQNIQALEEARVETPEEIKEAWALLRNEGVLPQRDSKSVDPLIATQWGQRAPYNDLCPSGTVTGCVATSMAQIMKYWEFPNRGTGSYSYYHYTLGNLSANFGATVYDWDNMPKMGYSSSPESVKLALSTLMYHCGVSVDMVYGTEVSGSSPVLVPNALSTYFGYASTVTYYAQDEFTNQGWLSLLKGELDAARPILYSGDSNDGEAGHAFVCDGYSNQNYFHFNWGWNGSYDGFFAIGALTPGSNLFSYNNDAVIGIQPSSYQLSAPTNLAAHVGDEGVNLSWNGVSGASYYKVYRDDELIAAHVNNTSYTDAAQSLVGVHGYYVKAVNSNGDRSPRSSEVVAEVQFQAPAPVDLEVELWDNNIGVEVSWGMPFGDAPVMSYGTSTQMVSSYGYNGNYTYWGQYFPPEKSSEYAGLSISKVRIYVKNTGVYTLYLGKGGPGSMTDVVYQRAYTMNDTGWHDLSLSTPLELDYTNGFWVMLSTPSSVAYPAAYCSYDGDGLEYASFISTNMTSLLSMSDRQISWLIRVCFTDEAFTYNVSRNGELLVSGLTEKYFADTDAYAGTLIYQVWASYKGVESGHKTSYAIDVVTIDVVCDPMDGTAYGGGLAEVGREVDVYAVPKPGKEFLCWKENDVVVSTSQTYSFIVEGDRQLQACFSGTGIDEDDDASVVLKVEVLNLNGVKLMTLEGDNLDWRNRLEGYAKGVYLLQITTDKGVIIKKVVL